jgi:hypothetical protein
MAQSEWDSLAREKLSAVLGGHRAEQIMGQVFRSMGVRTLNSAQDLYVFGQQVVAMGGFEGAVGALLSTLAVMRGASPALSET